jgi:hypothetical protein
MRKELARFGRGATSFLIPFFIIVSASIGAQQTVVDRIVAVVGTQIITLSDIRIEKTMRDVLGEPVPKDDRELLDELIDQRLIRAELDQHRGAEPTEAELDKQCSQIKDLKGLSPKTVREAVRERLRVERFLSERFGRSTGIGEAEIQKYYDEVFVPAARADGSSAIPYIDDVKEDILKRVADERTAADVRRWLDRIRRTARIEIFNFN